MQSLSFKWTKKVRFTNFAELKEKHSHWTPAIWWKGVIRFQYISMWVDKCIFTKTAHRIFRRFLMKLVCLKGKNWWSRIYGKISHFGIMPKNTPKIGFFEFCKKKKKTVFWCVDFLGLNHDGLYDSVKTTCVGKIWFSS